MQVFHAWGTGSAHNNMFFKQNVSLGLFNIRNEGGESYVTSSGGLGCASENYPALAGSHAVIKHKFQSSSRRVDMGYTFTVI